MRPLILLLLVGIAVGRTCAQSSPPVDPKVVLEVSIATNQREFRIGETIPLQLSFSSAVKDHYRINMAQYDRSGRMDHEQFAISPAQGAVDPLPSHTGSMGGLTNFSFLSSKPWSIRLNLNEWVRFIQPGEYRLVVSSGRVGARGLSSPLNPSGISPVTARSNEVTLTIVAADQVWQQRVLRDAVRTLDASAPLTFPPRDQSANPRKQAAETLRFLGTADAAREMVKRMRGEDSGGDDYVFMLGLISSPERSAARSALAEALADPDRPINSSFLHTLRRVNSDPTDTNATPATWREDQQRVFEELLTALPNKRGKALSASLSTAVNEAWNGNALPRETTEKLVSQLISMFDQLPTNEQNSLMSDRWDKIRSPAMIPLLKRFAQSYSDFPELREINAHDSLRLSASALRRWYELDPAGARPAIITEISRPRPRYDARVLGLLPDETLPEVDSTLAEHFIASNDLDDSSNLASLIARYATAAILPQITEKLDPKIGKWACGIQDPILGYLLRVNPAIARPRIEQAIAARGPKFSACNHSLFQTVSEIRYDPVLEEIGIQSLDDPDPEVAMTAATMLGKFGSPAAEFALWQRYASWSAQWSGRESQLETTFAERRDERVYQLGLGQNLMQALATGKAWLSDKPRLQRLAQLTKVPRIQQQLDTYLRIWEGTSKDHPTTIFFDHSMIGFRAGVAQYEFQSIDALKEKLAQFPPKTEFVLSISPAESQANDQTLAGLLTFLSSQGMSVAGEKRAH